jgi:carboxyl-terminal processing protease
MPTPESSAPNQETAIQPVAKEPAKVRSGVIAALFALVFCAGIVADRYVIAQVENVDASASLTDSDKFQILEQTWSTIRNNYVDSDSISDDELIYGAARGMVDALGDTGHSVFLDPEDAERVKAATEGQFVGIGITLDTSTGVPVIASVFEDSPAEAAGFRAQDVISAINGVSTDGVAPETIASQLRGAEGTEIEVTVTRPSTGESISRTLTRQVIKIEPVSWSMLPGDVGLIRLLDFSTGANDGVKAAIEEIKASGGKAIILDLRDNPGGYVHEALGVASDFFAEGTIVYQQQERGSDPVTKATIGQGSAVGMPVAVLINGGSASAAEIIAGSFQDNDRGTLFGEKTFGTGTVLNEFKLADGSQIQLGIAHWLTPKGHQIWHTGIEPDVKVALGPRGDPLRPKNGATVTSDELSASSDAQLKAAYEELTNQELAPAATPGASPVAK